MTGRERVAAFNERLAVTVTAGVGTMWCAYLFAGLALLSLPAAVHQGLAAMVTWFAQTFLQLVLLAVIIVGQNVGARLMNDLIQAIDRATAEDLTIDRASSETLATIVATLRPAAPTDVPPPREESAP